MEINQVSDLVEQMNKMAGQASGLELTDHANRKSGGFSSLLTQAIDTVNSLQNEAGRLETAYELGDENVDLASVMIASQKANLSFQAMVEVRNKLVSAYQEIMRMQI